MDGTDGFVYPKDEKNNSEYNISWNPTSGIKTDEGYNMSAATCLEHEFDHALSFIYNPASYRVRAIAPDEQYDNKEDRRAETGSEARTAIANQEFPTGYVRTNHKGGSIITVPNSTSNGDRTTSLYIWLNRHAKQIGNKTIYQRTK